MCLRIVRLNIGKNSNDPNEDLSNYIIKRFLRQDIVQKVFNLLTIDCT